jgi:hypothetical protein
MACNCKANEQIMKIQRHYGYKVNLPLNEKIKFLTEEGFKFIILVLILLVCSPFIFLGMFIMSITGKGVININNVTKLFLKKKRK